MVTTTALNNRSTSEYDSKKARVSVDSSLPLLLNKRVYRLLLFPAD